MGVETGKRLHLIVEKFHFGTDLNAGPGAEEEKLVDSLWSEALSSYLETESTFEISHGFESCEQ